MPNTNQNTGLVKLAPRRAQPTRQENAKARKLLPREVLVVEASRPRSGWRPRSTLRRIVGLAWLGYRACDVMSFEAGPHTAPVTVTRHDRNPTPRSVRFHATPARRLRVRPQLRSQPDGRGLRPGSGAGRHRDLERGDRARARPSLRGRGDARGRDRHLRAAREGSRRRAVARGGHSGHAVRRSRRSLPGRVRERAQGALGPPGSVGRPGSHSAQGLPRGA